MEFLNTLIFYILTILCILSAIFCLFQKNILNSILSAALLFASFSGFYFLLGAAFLGAVQILLFCALTGILLLFYTMTANLDNNKKTGFLFNLKTLFSPVLCVIFAFIIIPFILYQFKGYKTLQTYTGNDFALNLYKNNSFAFELAGFLILSVIIGITAVIIIKNTRKLNNSGIQEGEID